MGVPGRRSAQVRVRRAAHPQRLEAAAFLERAGLRLPVPGQEAVETRILPVVLGQVDDARGRVQRRGLVPEEAHVDDRPAARAPVCGNLEDIPVVSAAEAARAQDDLLAGQPGCPAGRSARAVHGGTGKQGHGHGRAPRRIPRRKVDAGDAAAETGEAVGCPFGARWQPKIVVSGDTRPRDRGADDLFVIAHQHDAPVGARRGRHAVVTRRGRAAAGHGVARPGERTVGEAFAQPEERESRVRIGGRRQHARRAGLPRPESPE